jgi:hypothetical protein
MMKIRFYKSCRFSTIIIIISLAMIMIPSVVLSQGPTTIRPIEDFVDAQGTFCIGVPPDCFLIVPPIQNFLGMSDGSTGWGASVDYAGLANEWIEDETGGAVSFGTETSGTVIELMLPDGRAEVRVQLHTNNALTWVVDDAGDFAGSNLLFGQRAPEVLAGAEPAFGDSFMSLVFINTAPGAPLPDFIQLVIFPEEGQELRFLKFNAKANGPLRDNFGVPDGTPGKATVIETGLFMTPFMGAVADGFPVERIKLQEVGN